MSISAEILALATRLCAELDVPEIAGLHLPDLTADEDFRDEFGIVFLSDDTAAPFYVSLPGTLDRLHRRFPRPDRARLSLQSCLEGLGAASIPDRALATSAWNALSQYLMRRESWGPAVIKYELTPANYPGVEALLAAALDDSTNSTGKPGDSQE